MSFISLLLNGLSRICSGGRRGAPTPTTTEIPREPSNDSVGKGGFCEKATRAKNHPNLSDNEANANFGIRLNILERRFTALEARKFIYQRIQIYLQKSVQY